MFTKEELNQMQKRDSLRSKADILDIEMRYAYFRWKLAENTNKENYWRNKCRTKAEALDDTLITLLST